jgi:hypothetical protein
VIVRLLIPIVFVALVVVGIRQLAAGGGRGAFQGHSVRRFFQYILLYGLAIVAALGLSGLLGRLLDRATLVAADQTDLARNVSFVIVGIPLYIIIALWTRRKLIADPSEVKSLGWGLYITLTTLTSLIVAMFALHDILSWAVGIQSYSGPSLARFIVWGALWSTHWWLSDRLIPLDNSRGHRLIGSLIGLVIVVVGLSNLLTNVIQSVLKLGGEVLFLGGTDPIKKSAVTFAVGIPVWFHYWIRTSSKSKRDPLWLVYVLLFGVGGGLVMAISGASAVLYQVLVWFLGEPKTLDASSHLRSIPSAAAFAFVGTAVWWYHHAILENEKTRSEVRRVYEYLMAGIGLIASAAGVTMVLVALIETFTKAEVIARPSGGRNVLLAAVTLIIVGTPVWWIFWQKIQYATQTSPAEEIASLTRRVYLFLLFGIGGLTSVIVLLIGVFILFDDIFKGNFGTGTVHRMRFCIAILITTGAVAGYHWMIYRAEREQVVAGLHGPRFVLLVGPSDPALVRAIAHRTGGRVESWTRRDDESKFGPVDDVMTVLENSNEESIILLAEPGGIRAIPVDR